MTPARDPFAHMAQQILGAKPWGLSGASFDNAIVETLRQHGRMTRLGIAQVLEVQSDRVGDRLAPLVKARRVKRTDRGGPLASLYEAV